MLQAADDVLTNCGARMMWPSGAGEGAEHLRPAESAVVRTGAERGGRPGG